ncbi:hypothetical protein [Staphylococcus cohnii]|uniref:hypothetical protein n=1 Tax=Staphylococcus cohnii TaxID=29382 RepID=UPI00131B0C93|nr:hypothetical protein [Staphylococcus cohnii]
MTINKTNELITLGIWIPFISKNFINIGEKFPKMINKAPQISFILFRIFWKSSKSIPMTAYSLRISPYHNKELNAPTINKSIIRRICTQKVKSFLCILFIKIEVLTPNKKANIK